MADELISVVVTEKGRLESFNSLEELEAWIGKERSAWDWAFSVSGEVNSIGSHLRSQFDSLSKQIQEAKGTTGKDLQKRLSTIQILFRNAYQSKKYLLPSVSAKAKSIFAIRAKHSPIAALYALASYLNIGFQNEKYAFFTGMLELSLRRSGIRKSAEQEKEALAELGATWDKTIKAFLTEKENQWTNLESLIDSQAKEQWNQIDEVEKLVEVQKLQFETVLQNAKSALTDLEIHYREELKLRAPVKYWSARARNHRIVSGILSFIILLSGFLFGSFFIDEVNVILDTQNRPNYEQIVALLAIATLGIWVLRILVRLFLSQTHLGTSSSERAIMVQVYLALLADEQVKPEDRQLIIQNLFRPLNSGIITDDSAPASIPEAVSRLFSK